MTKIVPLLRGFLSWCLVLALGALVLPAQPVAAQSIVAGEISGTVVDETGLPIREATVTLLDTRTQISRSVDIGARGEFGFDFVRVGEYEVRVESLGYRPILITGLSVGSGQRVRTRVELSPERPPVVQVDSLRWGSGDLPSSGAAVIRRISDSEIQNLPDRRRDLSGLGVLSSLADPYLGLEGLPGGETPVFSEGEAFLPALNPRLRGQTQSGLPFSRSSISSGAVSQGLNDIEWAGAASAILALESRTASGDASGGMFGLWSGGGLWSSSLVADPASATSIWGGADLSFPLVPDTALLALSVEGMRLQTPLIPSARDSIMVGLIGDDAPPADQPGVSETFVVSGTAKADWALSSGGHIIVRAGVASFKTESDRLGTPVTRYGADVPVEGLDGSIAAVVGTPLTDDFFLEVRGGVGFSSRDYFGREPGSPGARIVGSGSLIGTDPSLAGSFSRVDLGLGPVLHIRTGLHRAKVGLRLDFSSHDDEYVEDEAGSFVFGDEDALNAGLGSFRRSVGSAPATTYSVRRVSGFGQYRWSVLPGLDLITGVRWSSEQLPLSEVRPAGDLLALTGTRNDQWEENLQKVDGIMHLKWDLLNNGRTWLIGGVGIRNGTVDPGAITEVLTLDGQVRVQRGLGDVGSWPQSPDSASAPTFGTRLALFGPELKAPQTVRGSLKFSTALGEGLTFSTTGTYRRTEFLLRRNDLNRTIEPVGEDQDGRPLYGPVEIVGGVLGSNPELNRRFPELESVWALDADGWSQYEALTVGLESSLARGGTIAAHYTYSRTTDNRFGLLGGRAGAELRPDLDIDDWDEGVSDLDVPHRLTAVAVLPLTFGAGGSISGIFQYRSGFPFTPMVAPGLDANGDGSPYNDVAFIPSSALGESASAFSCISEFRGGFPDRNACRGDPISTVDLSLNIGLGQIGGSAAHLVVDAFNVLDADNGLPNPALLTVSNGSVVQEVNGVYQVPYQANPRFGSLLPGTDFGRIIRVGLRIGGGS